MITTSGNDDIIVSSRFKTLTVPETPSYHEVDASKYTKPFIFYKTFADVEIIIATFLRLPSPSFAIVKGV